MSERPSALTRFVGAAMMACGVLITLLSGGCTGVVLFSGMLPLNGRDASMSLLIILGVGLPFMAIGVALFFGGRAISRGGPDLT